MAFGGDSGLCSSPAVHSTRQFLFGTSPPGAMSEGMLGQARRHHPKHTSAYHEESSLHKSPESPGPSTDSHPTTLSPTGGPREHACVLCHPPRGAPAAAPPQPQPGTQAGTSCGRPACLDAGGRGSPFPSNCSVRGEHTPLVSLNRPRAALRGLRPSAPWPPSLVRCPPGPVLSQGGLSPRVLSRGGGKGHSHGARPTDLPKALSHQLPAHWHVSQ